MPIDVSQLVALGADLGKAPARIGREGSKAVRKAGRQVQQTAKKIAPKLTGELQGSIEITNQGDGRSSALSVTVTATSAHAMFVEYGTYKDAPQPFMAPAGDAALAELVAGIEAAGEAAING